MKSLHKQPCLKPQDLVVTLKIALAGNAVPGFAQMARALYMSASEVHAASRRAIASRLLEPVDGSLRANKASLQEFLIYGARYAFPAVEGPITRGLPTGVSAAPLRDQFDHANNLPLVWPDASGDVRGPSLCPLYPTVPAACRADDKLYRALATLDALRGGAARERETARDELMRMLA